MFSKAIVLLALIAGAFGGAVPAYSATYAAQPFAAPTVGLQSESTVRGFAGSSVSHQQKAIDSAFSSVRKTDTRITNPALYAAPVATYAAAPAVATYAQPAYAHQAYAQPAYAHQAYAQPAYAHQAYAAPAGVVKTHTYAAPAVAAVAQPAVAYNSAVYSAAPAPVVAKTFAAPAVAAAPVAYKTAAPVAYAAAPVTKVHAQPLLGVAYSAVSPAVATYNFNGYGVSYGY